MSSKFAIYQVLPRLFGNPTRLNKQDGSIEENGCGKFSAFTAKALKEIRNLGFTHIWYTGVLEHATKSDYTSIGIPLDHPAVVKGKAGSPYAVKDYYDITPDLADNPENRLKEFKHLIERTHKAELKVIIDFVPNHVARTYHSDVKPEGVRDFGENDNKDRSFHPHNNYYYIPGHSLSGQFDMQCGAQRPYYEFPAKATGNDKFDAYPGVHDWYETVKLNYGVDYLNCKNTHFHPIPDTWHKMEQILLYWASMKVDGFRCDMAEMVPVEFWNWAIQRVKEKHPHIIFIAEVYNPDQYRNYIFNGKFDYLYDKEGLYNILRSVICDYTPASRISEAWKQTEGIQNKMLSFLENHDEQRIASDFFSGSGNKGVPGMIVCATMNTNPFMVYFGQELGERGMNKEGFSGRDGRTTIFDYWNIESISNWINGGKFDDKRLTDDQKELKSFYQKLNHIALTEKAIYSGSFYDLMYVNDFNPTMNGKQYAFVRRKENDIVLIVTNFSDIETLIELQLPLHLFEFYNIPMTNFVETIDLLTNEHIQTTFCSSMPTRILLKKQSGRILKFKLKSFS